MIRTLIAAAFLIQGLGAAYAVHDQPIEDDIKPITGDLPECDNPRVLKKIYSRFRHAERNTFQHGVEIADVHDIRERFVRYEPHNLLEMRHCIAHADMTDGSHDQLLYMIQTGMGFAGMGWDVDFCIPGRDYFYAYDGQCRVLNYSAY